MSTGKLQAKNMLDNCIDDYYINCDECFEGIRNIKIEIFEGQNQIIKIQSEAIYDLLEILSQHIDDEEIRQLPVNEKLNHVILIRKELNL